MSSTWWSTIPAPPGSWSASCATWVPWRSSTTARDSAGSRLGPDDIDAAHTVIEGARWLHLTGITPALSPGAAAAVVRAKELARGAGVTVSLDLNIRRRLWSEADAATALRGLADGTDLVLGGLDEVALVGGLASTLEDGGRCDPVEAAEALLAAGARAGRGQARR